MLIGADLVTCQTQDLIRLHGCLLPAKSSPKVNLDAVFISHAIAGNFYNSRFLNRLALAIHEQGVAVLIGNNRGHDVVNYASAGGVRRAIGAANETVSDCQFDYAAWVNLLSGRGYQRIGVLGHSLGAIKAMYSQAVRPSPEVVGVVAFSASRLRYQDFVESDSRDRFLAWLSKAQELCQQGRGAELMEVDFPFPVLISANTYVDKYDQSDRYNWLDFAGQLSVPVLLAFGEKELVENAAFQGIIEQIESLGLNPDQFSIEVVAEANHYYTGCHQLAAERMTCWMRDQFPRD